MDHKIVYSKTGKGVLEIKNKAGKLSRELAKVLGLVDGKSSVEDLIAKSKLSDADVGRVLRQLEDRGYIKEFSNLSGAMSSATSSGSSSYVDDLDFTSQLSPGKRVYSSSQAEMRARESSDREQAEAEARRKREQAEQQKKNQAAQQAREEATRMARIEAERKFKEAAAVKSKQQAEKKAQQQAAEMEKTTRDLAKILEAERQALEKSDRQKKEIQARKAKEEAVLRAKEEAARKAKEAAERKRREEEERKRREEEERKRREEEGRKRRKEEEERKRREEEERKRREEEEERKRREEEERKRREEEERKQREEEERKRREEEERKRREEEERKRREEEERKRREEEERKQREEEERKQREEEERKRREEEERKQREEEERKRREEEDRRREEEDRRREEEDRRREEEERKRREEEDDGERRQREEEEDQRREEENRRREEEDQRREEQEEEDRRREEEEDRRREEQEEEERRREEEEETEASSFDIGNFDLPSASDSSESSSPSFDLPSTSSDSGSDSDTRIDLSSFEPESSESFTADFDRQQELLRKQEAEEKRQREEAEQARISMERAQREEEARDEAARRAAMEAEMRARVEMEKTERAERERAKEEEYKRKIEEEEERKRAEAQKKEREEIERAEGERNKREEDLVRRRQQAEESDRKRAEIKALQKRGRIRSPMERARPIVLGVLGIFALLVGAIQVMPMSGYIPTLEKMISNHLGEPVTIGSMKMSVLSGLQFKLGNVNIGTTQDVTLSDVLVTPELGSLFGDKLVLNSIQADGGSIVKEALVRFPDWLKTSVSNQRIGVRKISLRGVKLEMRTFELPSLNATLVFGRNGTIKSATVETVGRNLSVDIANGDDRAEVAIRANNWTAPIGAPVQLTDFTGSGTLQGSTLTLNEWEATVYGGQVNGTAELSWAPRWRLSSQFEFVRIDTEEMLAALSDTAKVTGSASGKGSFLSEAGSVDALLDRPSLQSSFVVKKGAVHGVDLVRALQAGRAGTQGGSTRFEELTGEVEIANGRYGYSNVRLAAGILSARSNFNISNNQEVSGRVSVALRSPAQQLSANLNLSGTLKGTSLRP